MRNANAAKLTHDQVQQIRSLHEAGFTARSIAPAFNVSTREVSNIIKGRNWAWLPTVPVSLPILDPSKAERLALRCTKRQTAEQRRRLDEYRRQLAAHIEDAAEREALALRFAWRIKRPKGKREISRTSDLRQ